MDQRVKGGTPPTTNSTLDPSPAPEDADQDQVAEKRRRGEGENGDVGKKEEERRGAGKKREGDKGAVLELLIEGRCGSAGQQQLQISGRETSCPEGNVRLRIGLQAKRTKKPPKILESYVCKPTIRTYQRQARGGLLKGDGEGGAGQQSKTSSTPDEATRENRSGLDAVQTTSKQTASAASPPVASSSLSSSSSSSSSQPLSLSSTYTTAPTPASVPAIASQGTKSAKQVPIKLADKTEANSNGSSERVKKEKLPSVNGQPVPAGLKPCSPTTDQTASTTSSTPSIQTLSATETRNEGKTSKKHNGLVQTKKQKGLSNGKGSADSLGNTPSSKIKVGKHSSSSSVSPMDSSTRPPVSTSSYKSRPDSPCSPSVTPKPQSSPTVDPSSAQSQDQDPSLQPSQEKKREKERKVKKEKRKEKKSKRDRLEAERAKSESRKEEGKKKKKEKGKDGKSRHGKEKDERHRTDDTWRDELKTERGKAEKKSDKLTPDGQRTEDNNAKCGETVDCGKLDKTSKVVNPGRPDEKDRADDSCKPVKQAEPATTTGDTSKSKEQDVSRHSTVPPNHPSSSAPPSLPTPPARAPVSPPSSPQEQDSRPLKKRKARRPSWTKLVHRAQRAENQEAPSDSQHNPLLSFPQNPKTSLPAKTAIQQTDESHPAPSSSLTSSSSPLSSATKPSSPKQSHPTSDPSPPASRCPVTPSRKRGRPKSHTSILDEPPPRLSPNAIPTEVPPLGCDGVQKAPVLEPSPILQSAAQSKSSPKKRGRPPKRPLPEDQSGDALNQTDDTLRSTDFHPPEKGNRQLKIRRLINEMKKRKKRRLHKVMLSGYVGKEARRSEAADGETSLRMCKSIETTTVHTLSALSSFGGKLGPQINVSKRGTIYMGKRRGRKPKAQTANLNSNSQNYTQSSLFTNPSETSLFSSNQSQPPPSHPFPSPSLTHSSGAQSPYSEGSVTEPTSLLFPHPFSLPSPSSSCTSPRPPSSSSLSPFVKKSCPCQGRHHFPFHQSSCKLSCPTPPLHHTPGSPGHLKEATPSPRSESHSEETLPSDSGIGTDNNSVSERGEMRGARGMLRLGQGSVILGGQKHSSFVDRSSSVSSPLSHIPRHTNPITNSTTLEQHRDRHRHRRRDYDCSSSCTCLCPCPCPGHNKCTHSDYYSCLGHNALKRQKNKHKKKHQQLHMQDPEFLSELEDLIAQFSEVHIGRRSWARTGLGQGFDGSGNAAGGRRHHSSSHSLRSNIFRINLNGFYSPHPSSYSANPSFSPQPFYPCQPVHCNRKPDRRQCGCPSKFQETIENMGFYSSYPPATTLYHHLPSSYPLPSPHQYAPHQPHHAHFLLNPARFHRRRSRLLREGALGGEVEGDMGGGGGGGPHLSSGFTSSLSCGCGRSEHKHKHKHRHRQCERDMDDEEELHEDEEEDGMEREGLSSSKPRSRFILGQGEGVRKGTRGMGSMMSPWLCENGNDSFSSAAASSSSSSTERFKHTSLTSLGLGSSHLSSFGGGWGGLGQSWTKLGGLGGTGFGNSSWRSFNGERHTGRIIESDGEDDDGEDVQQSHLYRTSPSPTHTNLFTSAAMATGGRGLRSGLASRNQGSGDRSWRRDEPAWTERREAGLQGDSRSRGQQKSVPTPDSVEVKNKRRPGRPRKHPLPSTLSSPTHSSAAPPMSSPDLLPGYSHSRDGREVGGRREERGPERDRGGNDTVQQVTESELQAKRKRGRKRKHGDSPCHQSVAEDKPECDTPTECFSQSDVDQAPSQPVTVQREERADGPPRKKFLRAGLYSDDYKTTDPPSQAQQLCKGSMDYTPGEHEFSLLPAPIHVGKYLRLKRIHFQLPYDVMWLWRHNQLERQPAVPLKRKRRYCRVKERTVSSHQTAEESSSDITSLFPHLDMEPLTSSERSFVVKHHVFLVRNWELVRDRQIRVRIERERERDAEVEERDSQRLSCDGANGDDSHIKSDQQVGVEVTVISSDPRQQSQDTSSLLTASPCPTETQNRQEEEGEEEKRGEEEVCSREQRRKRLNDLLLTLQHS
ncbi:histone-lysine N-methyltransferase ASH1L-like isoform X1 [Thunnus albacares]|uniref:histone-lysine N-methyltransferase ASH1L-like isoform X1 n=1 Tax=Thunnus maccoyii TaxID=8240 RepID=UPI001C4AF77F|nr:histone-lysine N-methyltransferase ASH1L-like isoform X1 [Thunnus maccoyii]XP_044214516.1 histone-lysine N-methyltransferase ASH1L-like isoform X1 [Thunnus albacares]